jgi:hypothetical protein
MKRAALAPSIAASLALCGCVDRANVTPDTLGRAVADAGFPCAAVVSTSELDADSWRVACDGGLAYVATVLSTGDVCVEPLAVGDFLVRPSLEPPRPGVTQKHDTLDRCAPDVKVR